jgi:aminopeptidase-like protein
VSEPGIDAAEICAIFEDLSTRLFPICRSLTGAGIRQTYDILSEYMPLERYDFPTGTSIYDWTVPREWNIRDAYIKAENGERLVDFQQSNLHVVNYSAPISATLSFAQLEPHLHTLPDQPDAIPYLTSYYQEMWGFCLQHQRMKEFDRGESYQVCIDSSLEPGILQIADVVLPGETEDEIFFSTYCCHPSMANNELSGPLMATMLYRHLASLPHRRYTYRFFFGPETIGALAYLSLKNQELQAKMKCGFILTCCGDGGPFTFKRPKQPCFGEREVLHVLKHLEHEHCVLDYFPTGSDDRQYCSPGFNLPVMTLCRSIYARYPEYHTSLDDFGLVTEDSMSVTFEAYRRLLQVLEQNHAYRNLKPFGEPFFSKYQLQDTLGGIRDKGLFHRALKYILSYSDEAHTLLEIADLMGVPMWELQEARAALEAANLIEPIELGELR